MRILAAACSLLLASPLCAAPSLEAARAAADAALSAALPPGALRFAPAPSAVPAKPAPPAEPVVQMPTLQPLGYTPSGALLARASLAALLDRQRDLLVRQLGGSVWNIGAAADAKIETYYLTFSQGAKLIIRPIGDVRRLTRGIDIEIEPGLVYNFRVAPNIFNPVRGSRLQISPARGTQGPRHETKTGPVLDAMKARSAVFTSDGWEYWMGFSTDVDPATGGLASTRSLVFFHEDGLSSKIWPVAESSLPIDQPVSVQLGDARFVMTRTGGGEIVVQQP